MDKRVYYTREKLASSDLNQSVSDSETYGQEIISDLIYGYNQTSADYGYPAFCRGLEASPVGAPDHDEVLVTAGMAYHIDGKKVLVPANITLKWDGTSVSAAETLLDRIDAIVIKHAYSNTEDVRSFIDVDPSSVTYGQAVQQNVVVTQEDSYQIMVLEGTPDAVAPAPPAIPSGYLTIAYVYLVPTVHQAPPHFPPYVTWIDAVGSPHLPGAVWDPLITSDVDNLIYTSGTRWFHNGDFYTTGTTDGAGATDIIAIPFAEIRSYQLMVETVPGQFDQISPLLELAPGIVQANTGVPAVTYRLIIRGI